MTSDLRDCCQQALLDHWAVCDARREDPPTGALSPAPAVQDTTDAAPEGIGLKSGWAASADTASTPAEANDA